MAGSVFNPRPQSINEVIDYILKRLGAELLEINVTEQQILDRVSDAIVYFQEHHVDGTYYGYFKTKIEATELTLITSVENLVKVKDCINGPGYIANVYEISDDFLKIKINNFQQLDIDASFEVGQTITINDNDFEISAIVIGHSEQGYMEIPVNVESIIEVLQLPTKNHFPGRDVSQIFTYRGSGLATSFYLQQVRQETLAWLTTLNPWADFNRYTNRAYLNSYDFNANIGNWIIFKVMTAVDPEEFPEMYGDTWFLNFCTELVRLQWGENLSKFSQVALLNGVTVNGPEMVSRAEERIKKLEEEMDARYRQPDDFFLA